MKKFITLAWLVIFSISMLSSQMRMQVPETLLPLSFLEDIINEASGDLALQNEIILSGVYRNRLPEEYTRGYFETDFILKKLKEYGLEDSAIIDLPTRSNFIWDAEKAELWMVKPEKRKMADLNEIAASLCPGSSSADVTAELVYVGPGNRKGFYEGKEVKGNIVLVNGPPETARRLAVDNFGAAGLVGYSSSHSEFDPDEVGWNSIRPADKEKKTFAFMISARLGQELRDLLEKGAKVEVKAEVKTQMLPHKEKMVAALLKGKDFPEEELVFTAHLYEGVLRLGANDNVSGCVSILETARVLKQLVDQGKIPPLRRSIRFLFVPEISGTAAYLKKYPEIAKRFFANINEDMVGEALKKNNSYFNLTTTPWSLPTYLNDVTRAFVEWVGLTQKDAGRTMVKPIISPNGTRDPFYYEVEPHSGGSDHIVFVDGGVKVAAVSFDCWPDMWYHTSSDTPDKSDPTQLKRAVVLSCASAVFLANADASAVEKMMAEVSARALERIGQDKLRAERMMNKADKKDVHTSFKEAHNVVHQAFLRETEALESVRFFIKDSANLESLLKLRVKTLNDLKLPCLKEIEEIYQGRCLKENIKPQKPVLAQDEIRLSKLVPVRTEKMKGYFDVREFEEKRRGLQDLPPYNLVFRELEVRNFIDGKRSILEIRNAASAEFSPIALINVENFMKVLEKTGFVELKKR